MLAAAALSTVGLACKKPDPAAIHRDKGDELFEKEQWTAAADEYELSLQADPKQDKLWERKAAAYLKAGKVDDAAASLVKMADSAETPAARAEIYRKVAGLYLEQRKPDEAEKYFLQALKADPTDADALAWLGEIASTRGGARAGQLVAVPAHLEKAVAYYDQAIALNPNAPLPYVNKRIALFKYMGYEQQQQAQAEQELRVTRGKAKIEEAKAKVAQHEAHAAELKRQIDELGPKITELTAKTSAKPK
jgi:tetratricopeptide (TPR) repeat protein